MKRPTCFIRIPEKSCLRLRGLHQQMATQLRFDAQPVTPNPHCSWDSSPCSTVATIRLSKYTVYDDRLALRNVYRLFAPHNGSFQPFWGPAWALSAFFGRQHRTTLTRGVTSPRTLCGMP